MADTNIGNNEEAANNPASHDPTASTTAADNVTNDNNIPPESPIARNADGVQSGLLDPPNLIQAFHDSPIHAMAKAISQNEVIAAVELSITDIPWVEDVIASLLASAKYIVSTLGNSPHEHTPISKAMHSRWSNVPKYENQLSELPGWVVRILATYALADSMRVKNGVHANGQSSVD